MSRLSITLNDDLHRSLKETAVRQGRTIGSIIEESLELRGIRSMTSARELLQKARINADLDEKDALSISIEETRLVRGGMKKTLITKDQLSVLKKVVQTEFKK